MNASICHRQLFRLLFAAKPHHTFYIKERGLCNSAWISKRPENSKSPLLVPCLALHSLPDPPLPPVDEPILTSLGEASLSSLGLCSYWPSGWYQSALELVHVSTALPWWASITAITLSLRVLLFPLLLRQRRSIALFAQYMPQLTEMQSQLNKARISGDYFEMLRLSQEMRDLQLKKLNLWDSFKVVLIQGPIFFSVFRGLTGMTSLPVESLRTGGVLWFTDLTMPDPYFLLPLISVSCMAGSLLVSTDIRNFGQTMRVALPAIPVVVFFVLMNMPAGNTCDSSSSCLEGGVNPLFCSCYNNLTEAPTLKDKGYLKEALVWHWSLSNAIALGTAAFFKNPKVIQYFNIPAVTPRPRAAEKKGFLEGFKESMATSRLLSELESRERLDAKRFQQSGRSAALKTFLDKRSKEQTIPVKGTVVSGNVKKKATGTG